jgi:hypothetical protein
VDVALTLSSEKVVTLFMLRVRNRVVGIHDGHRVPRFKLGSQMNVLKRTLYDYCRFAIVTELCGNCETYEGFFVEDTSGRL